MMNRIPHPLNLGMVFAAKMIIINDMPLTIRQFVHFAYQNAGVLILPPG
jgi:hypothetical protein